MVHPHSPRKTCCASWRVGRFKSLHSGFSPQHPPLEKGSQGALAYRDGARGCEAQWPWWGGANVPRSPGPRRGWGVLGVGVGPSLGGPGWGVLVWGESLAADGREPG